jgi:hypothetical protein
LVITHRVEDSVTASNHEAVTETVGKAQARPEVLIVRKVIATVAGRHEYLAAIERSQARNLERRHRGWIELVDAVVALGLRQVDFFTEADVQGELLADLPVVLDKSCVLKALG